MHLLLSYIGMFFNIFMYYRYLSKPRKCKCKKYNMYMYSYACFMFLWLTLLVAQFTVILRLAPQYILYMVTVQLYVIIIIITIYMYNALYMCTAIWEVPY